MTTLVHTRAELAAALQGRRVLVPTMGALHEGHASLMRVAREHAGASGAVVVSIFVNPMQFGAGEDLDRYPRTLETDLELCEKEDVDVVFAPSIDEVYPHGVSAADIESEGVTISPGALGDVLEGASRPGHFGGVLTVVAKLFGLVRPDVAVFGQKDYQQLALITRMAAELCLGVEVVGAPTQRDPDGLALSSRNRYLSASERQCALAISRALRAAQERARFGLPAARWAAMKVITSEPGLEGDYLAIRAADLSELPDYPEPGTVGRILVAAKVGTTRLIDNMPLEF